MRIRRYFIVFLLGAGALCWFGSDLVSLSVADDFWKGTNIEKSNSGSAKAATHKAAAPGSVKRGAVGGSRIWNLIIQHSQQGGPEGGGGNQNQNGQQQDTTAGSSYGQTPVSSSSTTTTTGSTGC